MRINDSSNKDQSLFHDALDWAGTNSNELTTTRFFRSANDWMNKVALAIWKASGNWHFDDANNTAPANATATLTEGTEQVTIPTTALRIRRAEVKDASGIWHPLRFRDMADVPGSFAEYKKTAGLPDEVFIEGRVLFLKAPPTSTAVTLTNGLRVYFDRENYFFATSETTKEPGFDEPFHRLVSLGAAYDFCLAKDKNRAGNLLVEIDRRMAEIPGYYASKLIAKPSIIHPKKERYD